MSAARSGSTTLAKHAAVYLAGFVFSTLLGIPLQVFVSRRLGAEGLGRFALLDAGLSLASSLVSMGLADTAARYVAEYSACGRFRALRAVLKSSIRRLVLVSGLGFVAVVVATPFLTERVATLNGAAIATITMGSLLLITPISTFAAQSLRGLGKLTYMVVGSSCVIVLTKAVLCVVLLELGLGLSGYVYAVVASNLVGAAWMAAGLLRAVRQMPRGREDDVVDRSEWSRFARIMYANSLFAIFTTPLDRFVLDRAQGASAVGILSVLRTLQGLPQVFFQMLVVVSGPSFATHNATGDRGKLFHVYHLSTDWIVRLTLPIVAFLILFARPVLGVFGAGFADAGEGPLIVLMAGQLVHLATGPSGIVLNMSGYEKSFFRWSIPPRAVYLASLWTLGNEFGLMGISIASVIWIVSVKLVAAVLARRLLSLHWWEPRFARWFLPAAACVLAAWVLRVQHPEPRAVELLAIGAAMFAVFHLVHLALGLHPDDREVLAALRRRMGGRTGL